MGSPLGTGMVGGVSPISPFSGSCAALVRGAGHSTWGCAGSPVLGVLLATAQPWGAAVQPDPCASPAEMAFQRSHRLNLLRLVVLLLVALAGIKFLFRDR